MESYIKMQRVIPLFRNSIFRILQTPPELNPTRLCSQAVIR